MDIYFMNQLSAIRRTVADGAYEEWMLADSPTAELLFAEHSTTSLDSDRFPVLLEDGSTFVMETAPLSDVFIVSE